MEDKRIIDLFNERSQEAITCLSEKYGRLSISVAENILGNISDSEECVNDAYFALWNNIPPEAPENLKTYLLKVVRNQALKKYHSNTALKRNSYYDASLNELEEVLQGKDSPEDDMNLKEISAAVNSFLGTLDRENRILFVRRYYFGDPVKKIASLTGKTPHFVSVRLSRIRESLKKYLRKEELI